MALGSNPYSMAVNADDIGKWGDIGGIMDIGPMIKLTEAQKHDAQLSTVELLDYGKGESMKFLEMLGIDRKVGKEDDDNRKDDGQGPGLAAPDHHRNGPTPG